MRIMKEKKELSHTDLMAELLRKVNFPLDMAHVKQRIESLIERDFLKRSLENAGIYVYVA